MTVTVSPSTSFFPCLAKALKLGDDQAFGMSPAGSPPSPGDGQHHNGAPPPMTSSDLHSHPDYVYDTSRCDTVRRKCRELCYNTGRSALFGCFYFLLTPPAWVEAPVSSTASYFFTFVFYLHHSVVKPFVKIWLSAHVRLRKIFCFFVARKHFNANLIFLNSELLSGVLYKLFRRSKVEKKKHQQNNSWP